ncbi:hypothetical protein BJV82DRAFT_673721 [Fennellomyces sp. T-0311]|nr:hypothetical protein BJV82DRAFT_673721 [Fennellomyces sp. T-0311]
MKLSLTFGVLAFIVAVVSADSAGGNNNEGDVSGLLNNALKSGLLTSNGKNSETSHSGIEDNYY